eukprot:1733985-Alexandrium_andersonii.AAC.1
MRIASKRTWADSHKDDALLVISCCSDRAGVQIMRSSVPDVAGNAEAQANVPGQILDSTMRV